MLVAFSSLEILGALRLAALEEEGGVITLVLEVDVLEAFGFLHQQQCLDAGAGVIHYSLVGVPLDPLVVSLALVSIDGEHLVVQVQVRMRSIDESRSVTRSESE